MKIFLCGQKNFGAAVLETLVKHGHEIIGVAPPPQERLKDKTEHKALKYGLPVISNCEALRGDDIPAGTELIVAAHSHWYISAPCREASKFGAIGFHPSLLPRHRGVDAVRWTVSCGDVVSGGTVFRLDNGVDTGDIILQRHVLVGRSWDYHKLWHRLFPLGVSMLLEAITKMEHGEATFTVQNEEFATWEPSFDERKRLYRSELVQICG